DQQSRIALDAAALEPLDHEVNDACIEEGAADDHHARGKDCCGAAELGVRVLKAQCADRHHQERGTNRGDCDRNLLEDERDHREHCDEGAENRLPFVHVLKSPLSAVVTVRSAADIAFSHMNQYSLYE